MRTELLDKVLKDTNSNDPFVSSACLEESFLPISHRYSFSFATDNEISYGCKIVPNSIVYNGRAGIFNLPLPYFCNPVLIAKPRKIAPLCGQFTTYFARGPWK